MVYLTHAQHLFINLRKAAKWSYKRKYNYIFCINSNVNIIILMGLIAKAYQEERLKYVP